MRDDGGAGETSERGVDEGASAARRFEDRSRRQAARAQQFDDLDRERRRRLEVAERAPPGIARHGADCSALESSCRPMPIFVLFALVCLAALGIFLISIVAGTILCFIPRHRTLGTFVLVIPTMSALVAALSSWGAMFFFDWLARRAASPAAMQRWEIVSFWSWPVGFLAGGAGGAALGVACGLMIVRRRVRRAQEVSDGES